MKFIPSTVYFTQRERLVICFVLAAFLLGTAVWHFRREAAARRVAQAAAEETREKAKF